MKSWQLKMNRIKSLQSEDHLDQKIVMEIRNLKKKKQQLTNYIEELEQTIDYNRKMSPRTREKYQKDIEFTQNKLNKVIEKY